MTEDELFIIRTDLYFNEGVDIPKEYLIELNQTEPLVGKSLLEILNLIHINLCGKKYEIYDVNYDFIDKVFEMGGDFHLQPYGQILNDYYRWKEAQAEIPQD